MRHRLPLLLACASLSLLPAMAQADENYFGYSYGTETLPAGGNEAYVWWTRRTGKGEGSYQADDLQLEFEHGWTDRFQTAIYLTGRAFDYSGGSIRDEDTGEAESRNSGLRFDGVKAALKWSLKSPERDGYGLALYLEPQYKTLSSQTGDKGRELALETKLLLQKNFFDGQLVTVYNLTLEPEWEREDGAWEDELYVENSAGVSYRFAPNWFVGLETRVDMAFPEYGAREFWSWHAGPTLHYGGQKYWATLSWLPQVKGGPVEADRSTRLHLEERERNEVRVKFGLNF